MVFIVKHEIEKKEILKKQEFESKRQEKIRQKRLEDEESKKEAIRILKVIGIIIAIIAVFMIIYIPIDYCRINKDKPHVWTLIDSKTKCIGGYKYGETKSNVRYLITIPDNFKGDRRSDNNLSNCFYDYYGNSIDFVLVSQTILPVIENKIQQYKKDGFRIEYKVNTDSLVWFTYEKYSLLDSGHLLGNCVFILKPSPIMDSPFPNYDNRNILLCCEGFGVTKEIADSIATSIRIKFDTLPNNTYHASHTLKKYRSVRKKDWDIYDHSNYYDETKYEISLTIPNDFYQVSFNIPHNRITLDDTCKSLFMTDNMDAGISIISHPKESITYFLYPTDSIIEKSSMKCKVAGCDALKIETSGFCAGKEYKYILYQLIKDHGYSTYQEPIYGKETYNISNEERRYINGVLVNANQPYKQTRTIIKGYKPNLKKIKNDDLYMSLLFGMTPEWHNNNKGIVDTVINSIKIIDK